MVASSNNNRSADDGEIWIGLHLAALTRRDAQGKAFFRGTGVKCARPAGGNHRGLIFGLNLGTALIERDGIDCPTRDNRRGTAPHEGKASASECSDAVPDRRGDVGGLPDYDAQDFPRFLFHLPSNSPGAGRTLPLKRRSG